MVVFQIMEPSVALCFETRAQMIVVAAIPQGQWTVVDPWKTISPEKNVIAKKSFSVWRALNPTISTSSFAVQVD